MLPRQSPDLGPLLRRRHSSSTGVIKRAPRVSARTSSYACVRRSLQRQLLTTTSPGLIKWALCNCQGTIFERGLASARLLAQKCLGAARRRRPFRRLVRSQKSPGPPEEDVTREQAALCALASLCSPKRPPATEFIREVGLGNGRLSTLI
ncbi:hypothetical protein MRX96_058325 [Rhipicephalus microplus]